MPLVRFSKIKFIKKNVEDAHKMNECKRHFQE